MRRKQQSISKQGGMMLLEGMIAIVIFSVGILAIVGLQAASVRQTTDAKYRVDASLSASEALGKMWVDRIDLSKFVGETDIANLPVGKRKVEVNGRMVTVTVSWLVPGETVRRSYSTISEIAI